MDPTGRLRDYPFVVVRLSCRLCPRVGRYRLATLAERFGANASLAGVLQALSASCPRQRRRDSHPGPDCGAYYPDLPPRQPPDLPVDLQPQRLRLILGGRSDAP
jgi:hypothetical protein